MKIYKSHKIKLYPTKSQEVFFKKSCGVARFSYNWGLSRWKELYEAGEKVSYYSLDKELRRLKHTQFTFIEEVGKCCHQYAIVNLNRAFQGFFKKQSRYPKFKKKGMKDSFVCIENNDQYINHLLINKKLWVPKLGYVKTAENFRFINSKVLSIKIVRRANLWFTVINCEIEKEDIPVKNENQVIVGIDLGISNLVTTSNDKFYQNPKALKSKLKQLKRYHKSLSRKKKGSNNYNKQKIKLSRLYYKISCIRETNIHQITREIVDNSDIIVLEDLNVRGMVKNKHLSQSISDSNFGEIRKQFEYKCNWNNKQFILADRFYPSTKTCSNCGNLKSNIKLSDRVYICDNCNLELDRDLNAALNLKQYGINLLTTTSKSEESKASGEESTIDSFKSQFSSSLKEETPKVEA